MTLSIIRLLLIFFFLIAALNLLGPAYIEPRAIFFPFGSSGDPAQYGLKYENVYLNTPDGETIHGWFLPGRTDKVILFFHGNGGSIPLRLPYLKKLSGLGPSIFIIDYHGYGKSTGKPSEINLYMDATTAYDYLKSRGYTGKDIFIMGRSLGSAVATWLAVRRPSAGVILHSPLTSVPDFIPPGLRQLIRIRNRFDSYSRIADISVPLLILHSREDQIVPYSMGQRLYRKATPPKKFVSMDTGVHDEMTMEGYLEELEEFISLI